MSQAKTWIFNPILRSLFLCVYMQDILSKQDVPNCSFYLKITSYVNSKTSKTCTNVS